MKEQSAVYYRLIALWVLCEAMLGGIIHGFRIPVSGLVVGSAAIICICLIAYYVPAKGAILKATVIVAIFKMMLSPQSPPPAYIAVFFQGALGELIFFKRKFYRAGCFLLSVLGLLESGLQRIIVLTIVYGNDFWKVVNDFINGLTRQNVPSNYSLYIAGGYVLLHLLAGIALGWWAGILPRKIEQWKPVDMKSLIFKNPNQIFHKEERKKKSIFKKGLLVIWIALIILYIQSYFKIGDPILPSHLSLRIFIRSIIVVLAWFFLLRPAANFILKKWLAKKQSQSQRDIEQVILLLPVMQQIAKESWKISGKYNGWKRVIYFCKTTLAQSLSYDINSRLPASKKIYILTGPVQSGKTTKLVNWSAGRNDIYGVLTPVIDEKRMFMDAESKQQFNMEAISGEEDVFIVGKYNFSKTNFTKATAIIQNGLKQRRGWLVVDEIGPLELQGKGFHDVLKEMLQDPNTDQNILWVVRESLVENVIQFFNLKRYQVTIIDILES